MLDILSRMERAVAIKPARAVLYQRIAAILFGLCGAFILFLLAQIVSNPGAIGTLTVFTAAFLLVVLACAVLMLWGLVRIWQGDVNAMLVAWMALAVTMVIKGLTLSFSLGALQLDGAALLLLVTGIIAMRHLLGRGFALSRAMSEPASPAA
jgi:hypothetical protein